jgi:predicted ATPase
MLQTLAIEGYRSIRDLVVPLHRLTVVTGPNGSGKSSLYRSLRLLAAAGRDGAIPALAREGGLPSTLWAGPESGMPTEGPALGTVRKGPVALRLGFASDADGFGYAVDFGLPVPAGRSMPPTLFGRDPVIKAESLWSGPFLRPGSLLTERRGPVVRVRGDDGWRTLDRPLAPWESMLAEFGDPDATPELLGLRAELRDWRFYDAVRTDAGAPARQEAVGTRTPILSSDGSDLAAALRTIQEQEPGPRLAAAIDRALPGSRVEIEDRGGRFALLLHQPGLLRPLDAAELSDGTLRYLVWAAALLSVRPATFLALNEPETSLHPSVIPALAELLVAASEESQLVVVSHALALVDALEAAGATVHRLEKSGGETRLEGQGRLDAPPWHWPAR